MIMLIDRTQFNLKKKMAFCLKVGSAKNKKKVKGKRSNAKRVNKIYLI